MPADAQPPRDAAALRQTLCELGVRCQVEVSDASAVLVPDPGTRPIVGALRHEVVRAAARHGFTHVSVEVADAPSRPVPAAAPTAPAHAALPCD